EAILSSELGNLEKVSQFIEESARMGISVLGRHINESRENFTPILDPNGSNGSIRFGLAAIKGVGDAAAHAVIEELEANGPYQDMADLVRRTVSKGVNRRVLECLIKTGAFDFVTPDRHLLLDQLESTLQDASQRQHDELIGQGSFLDLLQENTPAPAQPKPDPTNIQEAAVSAS